MARLNDNENRTSSAPAHRHRAIPHARHHARKYTLLLITLSSDCLQLFMNLHSNQYQYAHVSYAGKTVLKGVRKLQRVLRDSVCTYKWVLAEACNSDELPVPVILLKIATPVK